MTEHKEVCLSIDDTQSVGLQKGTTEFKNYFKEIPVPFNIYADFEHNLEKVESYQGFYSKKYQDHILCIFANKLVCVDDKFSTPIVVFRGKNVAFKIGKEILKMYEYCKKVAKKHFSKNLIITEEEED